MNFLRQYIKIIAYAVMGIVFVFAGFYLLINAYHYLEIRKDFVTNFDTQLLITDFDKKLANIESNISGFSTNTYQGKIPVSTMQNIQYNLRTCKSIFQNETITNMRKKDRISIIDVYNLRESYENDILSKCIIGNLYWTTNTSSKNIDSTYLKNNEDMIQLYINDLLNETSYLKKDLINNSSYFYNTSLASSVKDNTKDGYYEVMNAYSKAASFVEFVSGWFKNEVEGNYD